MKRIALLTVFFYCCTFAAPQRSYAVVPLVAIGAAAIGTAMLSTAAGTYYAKTGENPIYQAYNAAASAADYIFQPTNLAIGPVTLVTAASFPAAASYYLGKSSHLGAKLGDLIDYVKESAEGLFPGYKDIIDSASTESIGGPVASSVVSNPTGTVWSLDGVAKLVSSSSWSGSTVIAGTTSSVAPGSIVSNRCSYFNGYGFICYIGLGYISGTLRLVRVEPMNGNSELYSSRSYWKGNLTDTNNPISYPPPNATIDHQAVKNALQNWPSTTASETRDIIKDLPADKVKPVTESIPTSTPTTADAPSITQSEVNNFYATNTQEVYNKYLEVANNTNSTYNQIEAAKAAAQTAAAQQKAADQEKEEETFSPISDTPFGLAYSPSPYDIPTRFNTFLNTVKTSSLFSFSSNFFNSLPGGGSPIYQIDGGSTFGTHTIDLSETMSGGLAVVKAVLLALFGFLSIRAVIMKR